MGLRIITDTDQNYQVMYCSTTMVAFGPIHYNGDVDLIDFIEWLPVDARKYTDVDLNNLYYHWLAKAEAEQE